MSACFDSSTSTSRGLVFVTSFPIWETKAVFDILKWRRRLFTSFRALLAGRGVHSVQTMKFAGILSSESSTSGRVSVMASFIVNIRTCVIPNSQVVALGFDIRIDHLVVKELGALRPSGDAPRVEIE